MTRGKGEMYEAIPWFMRGDKKYHTMVVAEIGNNHDGSLGNLIHMIELSAMAGVDAVKIQCHWADYESTTNEQFPKRFSYHPQDRTRKAYWERMQLDAIALEEIDLACKRMNVKLIASVFCKEVVSFLLDVNAKVDIWALKIPSGEADNQAMMEAIHESGIRTILSTGMSDTRELNANVCLLLKEPAVNELYVLQCTTEYPTLPFNVGMNVVEIYSRNMLFKGGLSDHSGTIYPSIVAAYLGAEMVEVHVCYHKSQFGADIQSSITFDELEKLVEGVRYANGMRMNPINKDLFEPTQEMMVYREGKKR